MNKYKSESEATLIKLDENFIKDLSYLGKEYGAIAVIDGTVLKEHIKFSIGRDTALWSQIDENNWGYMNIGTVEILIKVKVKNYDIILYQYGPRYYDIIEQFLGDYEIIKEEIKYAPEFIKDELNSLYRFHNEMRPKPSGVIRQHFPTFFSGFEKAYSPFSSLEELLDISWVKIKSKLPDGKSNPDFFRYSICFAEERNEYLLIAEYSGGDVWYVVGYMDKKGYDIVKELPIWEYKRKELVDG